MNPLPSEEFTLHYVPIHTVTVNPFQPRRQFDQNELDSLVESIRKIGLIHPPLAMQKEEGKSYELIAGERRWLAAKQAGFEMIPLLIKNRDSFYSAQAALIENIQRVDLNPMEIAFALKTLLQQFRLTQEALAQQIGKKRSTVANYVRLLSLPEEIQQGVRSQSITMGHAKAILSLEEKKLQLSLYSLIVSKGLTVRQAEEAAIDLLKQPSSPTKTGNIFLEDISRQLQKQLGCPVVLQTKKGQAGKIIIEYLDWDELERLIHLISGNTLLQPDYHEKETL